MEELDATPLGELVRGYRARSGMTQHDLASRAGISVRALRDLERGRTRRPHGKALRALADALKLDEPERERLRRAARAEPETHPLRIEVLGPLAVHRGPRPVDVGPLMQRRLLALLAIQPARTVSPEEVVDTLWSGLPPRTHVSLIHSYVARLRQRLKAPGGRREEPVIVSVPGGYRLDLPPSQLDVARFAALVRHAWQARGRGDDAGALAGFADALRCWRGEPAAGLGPALPRHPAAAALSRERVEVCLAYADLALQSRQYAPATVVLQEIAAVEPLHEGLYARLMLALAGSGQQGVALRLFDDLRTRLREELGVAPGPELAAAHLRVLRQELPAPPAVVARPTAVPKPAQLPPGTADFTGRAPELRRLNALASAPDSPAPTALPVLVVAGPPGVGKTALAIHWGHRVAGRYPDGQLYLDLRGYAPDPPLSPAEALRHLLIGCGVAPDDVPADPASASGWFRSLLAGKRMLVLLDNAAAAEQVRPLLPGEAGCLVLVTSRDRLEGLVARDGARVLSLAVLSERESVSLLARVIGAERVRAEPAAAAEIAGLCGHLPLALRIAAAHLSGAHTDLASYAAELRESPRITKLAVSGDEISTGVEMAFQHSYVRLSAADRRLFRFIGLAPGADFTTEDAARLADLPPDQTAAGLAELCQAHLLEHRGHRRYRLHDLIRSYANQCGETEDAPPERDAALLRLVTAYLDSAAAAARLLHPQWLALLPRHVGTDPHRFTGRAAALAWLEAERANLVAAVRAAAPRAWPQVSDLAYAVRGFLAQRRHIDDLIEVSRAAVAASTAAGDRRGEASAQMNLAIAYGSLGDFDAARRRFAAVLATARRHHWTDIQTVAHHNLGFLYNQVGQLDQAAEQYRSALALDGGSGQALRGSSLTNLADVCYRRGQVDEAVRLLTQALEFAGQTAALGVAATAHTQLGQLYHLRAEPELARRHLTVGLARFRQVGNRSGEAEALHLLAAVRLESGDPAGARELAETALDIARDREDGPAEIGVHLILGELYLRGEQAGRAATEYAAARALAEDRGQRYGAVEALIGAARAATALGHVVAAAADGRRALCRARRHGYLVLQGRASTALAHLYAACGRPGRARDHLARALRLHRQTGDRLGEASSLALLHRLGV